MLHIRINYRGIKEDEMNSKELLKYYESFFELSDDGFMVTDAEGRIILVNPASLKRMEMKREDVIGKTPTELLEQDIYTNSTVLECIKRKTTYTSIVIIRNKYCLSTSKPVFDDDGNLIMTVTNNRSDSVLEQYNELLEKERALQKHYNSIADYLSAIRETNLIYASDQMKSIVKTCLSIAGTDGSVLLQGETGVGKEVIAKFIHSNSPRRDHPIIPVNCSAIPPELFESEFFGYKPNAFTGASAKGKIGLVQMADQGTLFLDELGELPLTMQTKLLRFVETGEYLPVGASGPEKADVRIIAATSRDLYRMMEEKTFRRDLFYRLGVLPVFIPPLRERPADIEKIADFYVARYNQKYGKNVVLTASDYALLKSYDWPGNIRELRNSMERTVILNNLEKARDTLSILLNRQNRGSAELPVTDAAYAGTQIYNGLPLSEAAEDFERRYIRSALVSHHGKLGETADALGMHRSTLYRKLNP